MSDTSAPSAAAASTSASSFTVVAVRMWLALALVIGVLAYAGAVLTPDPSITELFFREQDIPALLTAGMLMALLRFAPLKVFPEFGAPDLRGGRALALTAAASALIAAAGWSLVFSGFPLSMDEFLARFDAQIFVHGRTAAPLPQAWLEFITPLQPQFMMSEPGRTSWASLYLPVNAAALSLFYRLGAPWLAGAFWTALAVAATWGVARRLWPQRPDAALTAALLLATSTQVLVTGMTTYAMSAHLALNMTWLWLFLRGGRLGHLGALVVGFLAAGLHQVVFHPLFAAPFILGLMFERRWRLAGLYVSAYAAISLFWMDYWALAVPAAPAAAKTGGSGLGLGFFGDRVAKMLGSLDPAGPSRMAENLMRLFAWQNPLMPALAAVGAWGAVRTAGPLRWLMAGAALTLLLVAVILPFQGHGWGYRYLHGFLGGFCLIAAAGWMKLADRSREDRRAGWAALALACTFSVVVLLPLRAIQIRAFIAPYLAGSALIERSPAEVVVVDPTGLFHAPDLVRNDPWLANTPKVMDLTVMSEDQVRALCASRRIAILDRSSGIPLRTSTYPADGLAHLARMRRLMAELRCGAPLRATEAADARL